VDVALSIASVGLDRTGAIAKNVLLGEQLGKTRRFGQRSSLRRVKTINRATPRHFRKCLMNGHILLEVAALARHGHFDSRSGRSEVGSVGLCRRGANVSAYVWLSANRCSGTRGGTANGRGSLKRCRVGARQESVQIRGRISI